MTTSGETTAATTPVSASAASASAASASAVSASAVSASASASADVDSNTTIPKRPVSVVVVSTAQIARDKVVPALLSVPSTVIVGVSSRNKERAQAFVDEHIGGASSSPSSSSSSSPSPSPSTTGCRGITTEELFAGSGSTSAAIDVDTNVDAVYVPLPSRVRNPFLVKALEHGMHVYSEKPHGGTVNEFRSVLALAASKNLQWMDGTMWYHSFRTGAMEDKLSSALLLGKVRRVSASFTWGGGGLVDETWREGGNLRTDPSREPMGMLGDSGHYPVSLAAWAFGWELPTKVRAVHTERNTLGAILAIEAVLWFGNGDGNGNGGGRFAVIDTSCNLPHRSQGEIVCDNGVLKVDDLVGGQGRTGNFAAYEGPFVGSSSFVVGDYLGKDTTINVEPCDHAQRLVQTFSDCVRRIRDEGGRADPEWSKRSLCTHTILCAIFESAMRNGVDVELINVPSSPSTTTNTNTTNTTTNTTTEDIFGTKMNYVIEGQRFTDLPTRDWTSNTAFTEA